MITNKLFKKIIVILLIIIMVLPNLGNIVIAESDKLPDMPSAPPPPPSPPSGGGGGGGSPPSNPGSGSGSTTTTPTEPDVDPVIEWIDLYEYDTYEDVYCSIEGILWEDFNNEEKFANMNSDDPADTADNGPSLGYWGNGKFEEPEWLIGGINMKLFNGTSQSVAKTVATTDVGLPSSEANNNYAMYNYKFDADTEDYTDYSVGFDFGTNSEYRYRYNGQDYSAHVENMDSNIDVKPIFRGKGVTQVYLAIDFSTSMYSQKTNDGRRRIDAIADSVKKLIKDLKELPEETNNLIVGIIAYAGSARIAIHLTNDFENMESKIDELVDKYTPSAGTTPGLDIIVANEYGIQPESKIGTNISAAIEKAISTGFYDIEDDNKLIILFSDGAPSVHNEFPQVYGNSPTKNTELMNIAKRTNKDIKEIDTEEYGLIPVLIESYDGDEIATVEATFDGIEKNTFADDSDIIINEISEMIKNLIKDELIEDGYCFMGAEAYQGTADNPARRATVNNNYEQLYYGLLEDFRGIDSISDYRPPENEAEFIDKTWMKTTQHPISKLNDAGEEVAPYIKPFKIKKLPEGNCPSHENCDRIDKGEGIVSSSPTKIVMAHQIYQHNHYVPRSYVLNFYLARRQEFELTLNEYVTGTRVTLNDGTVIHENILPKNKVENIANKNLPYPIIVDEVLLHGAVVEIEYAIEIKNTTNIKAKKFSIVDYLDDENLVYNPDTRLLTNPDMTNSQYGWYKPYDWSQPYGWNEVAINKLKATNLSGRETAFGKGIIGKDKNWNELTFKDENCLKVDINNEPLEVGHSKLLRVVLSIVIDNSKDINFNYINHSEIVGYSNIYGPEEETFGRRMEKVINVSGGMPEYTHLIAGNKGLNTPVEADEDMSLVVQVMIPTGK